MPAVLCRRRLARGWGRGRRLAIRFEHKKPALWPSFLDSVVPRADRRDHLPVSNGNLPNPANSAVYGHFSIPVSLEHMKNTNQKAGDAPGASKAKLGKKVPVTKLPRMEMYAVLGLELSKKILEKLQAVEESIEILARQVERELDKDE